jgi:hypothetical protein
VAAAIAKVTWLRSLANCPNLAVVKVAIEEAEDRQHLLVVQSFVLDQSLDKADLSIGQNNLRHTLLDPLVLQARSWSA